ncbi:uncharacterized protein bif [Chelonus insularis]|uniref:uncharacterized protein bif n=1 Tax=Chelonus insularis TaxID=460826 RepID=UPI00158A9CC9|nr:uncharacterized protein LOC118074694 [Chelonus insularis]
MASGTAENNSNIPQWKRDLIQRRRQQNKALTGNGVKVGSPTTGFQADSSNTNNLNQNQCTDASKTRILEARGDNNAGGQVTAMSGLITRTTASGVTVTTNRKSHESLDTGATLVACNMRLEADASLCPALEDTPKFTTTRSHIHTEHSTLIDHFENEDCHTFTKKKVIKHGERDVVNKESSVCVYTELRKTRMDKFDNNIMPENGKTSNECDSDSSEELQYGPGIVNRLKSKYLNLTLREMNKNRASVQRFRRAASLEDLLDCNDEPEKVATKFTKKSIPTGVAAKTERYRNATRGNDSMKRARSVEALMRYQVSEDTGNKLAPVRQEPVNDHIVLIDRTAVKIESRLMDSERPKALNKPKRLKPLLAETERPPPDLVKTTMRIFEGSVKKLKPKGEVAAKVATFKTINDTFKAQSMKKVITKPLIQPKPFINGTSKIPGSSKKIVLPTKPPTAELIEKADASEEYKNDGVVTDPIVQSVSSVVSKFQQIEKSHSPSPSPEPTHKFKFSPSPSPEPPLLKFKVATETGAKSPPITPQISSPIITSPVSPKKDSIFISESPKSPLLDKDPETDHSKQLVTNSTIEEPKVEEYKCVISDDSIVDTNEETVDGARTISKSALENISKAGSTMQFHFEHDSPSKKSYLPRIISNGQSLETNEIPNRRLVESNLTDNSDNQKFEQTASASNKIQERLESSAEIEAKDDGQTSLGSEQKPIGAISSLGLAKTNTSPAISNESKIVKNSKVESTPPQKQIGIIRPLVSTKTQMPQQNLSNRELEKNLINRVKSIEQPTKVVVSLKSADEIQPVKKSSSGSGGLWDIKPWNQQNNTMVFNFSNRKDVPDYIENDGLIIRRKREKPKVGDGGIIVLDATLDASTTDDSDCELSRSPPSPCDVSFLNDNILINGRSNLSKNPRNHKHRIQFDDTATRTFEYPSEASILEDESSCVDGETSASSKQLSTIDKSTSSTSNSGANPILGGGSLATFTPSKVDLTSESFELGVTRTSTVNPSSSTDQQPKQDENHEESEDYLKSDVAAWGAEATADLLY